MGIMDGIGKMADCLEKESQKSISKELNAFRNCTRMTETDKPKHIKTINEGMEGQGIYKRRVISIDGERYEGVFPRFESMYQMRLPKGLYTASDSEQMKYCTQRLKFNIERNPELAERFTKRQLEQIRDENPRISGLTWHHNESPGIMQLVDANEHDRNRHTGGRSLWGGGSDYR